MNDLTPLENPEPGALFAPGGLEPILARIETDARALVPDISTVKGRGDIASLAAKVAKAKTYLDGLGKDYTADLKRQTGSVDAERRAMRDRLDSLKAEIRRPLDEWEQQEVDRVAAIRARMAQFAYAPIPQLTAADHARDLGAIEAIEVDDSFAEFRGEAQLAKEGCLYRLTVARDAALHREAEAARMAAEAEAARAQAQAEREERIAREAAERATREAQDRARAEAARAEQERISASRKQAEAIAEHLKATQEAERRARDAEDRAKREAAMARARAEVAVEQEQARATAARLAQERENSKRSADQSHRERIHSEIVEDFEREDQTPPECMGWDVAVDLISAGRIRHLRIVY